MLLLYFCDYQICGKQHFTRFSVYIDKYKCAVRCVGVAILESRYDTYHDTSLMLRLLDYQAKIKEA